MCSPVQHHAHQRDGRLDVPHDERRIQAKHAVARASQHRITASFGASPLAVVPAIDRPRRSRQVDDWDTPKTCDANGAPENPVAQCAVQVLSTAVQRKILARGAVFWLGLLAAGVLGLSGCKSAPKASPPPAQSATTSGSVASAKASPSFPSSAASAAAANATSTPPKPPGPLEQTRKPVALDEAAQRTATQYLALLARGRKATTAKDFAQAETEFSACLKLVPGDPRALGERGYARLLANKLDDADADFKVAVEKAGSTALLAQLVHNRLLVARQRGDEQAARSFEQEKQRIKASRRIAPGVDCSADAHSVSRSPERPKTLTEAWSIMTKAHAQASSSKPEEIALGNSGLPEGAPPPPPATEAELWQQLTNGAPRDGGWAITTSTGYGFSLSGHALFSKAGQFYLFPAVYSSLVFRCGQDGGGELSVGGGGMVPWHIKFEQEQLTVAYMCEASGGGSALCGSAEDSTGTPVQSYCALVSSNVTVTVLDSNTFEGLFELTVGARPSGASPMGASPHLLDVEWLADHLVMNACGARRQVPYSFSD